MGSAAEYRRDEAIAEAIHARIVAGVYDDPQNESTESDCDWCEDYGAVSVDGVVVACERGCGGGN